MIEQGWVTAAQRVLAIDSYNSEALRLFGNCCGADCCLIIRLDLVSTRPREAMSGLPYKCLLANGPCSRSTDHLDALLRLQPCIFCLGLTEDRDARVGFLPQFEEVLESLFGFRRVASECGTACHTQIGK
jgi:hypothetical protein